MLQKHLGFFFNLIAIGLFVPGILLPMFSLNMEVIAQVSGAALSSTIIDKELSLLGTIKELWINERILVASLIAIFSVGIPVLKMLLMLIAYLKKHTVLERRIISFVAAIGKWSMADVFVVAIFLAVLATNHDQTQTAQQISLFSFKINLLISSETLSAIGAGFYYFTAYCLVSLLGSQLSLNSVKVQPK